MSLILSGTDGLSEVDGSAATPAIRGTDANTGIFFGTDIIGFSEGGVECARFNADSQFVAAAGTAALPVITTTGDTNTGIFFPAADTIGFAEGGAEIARFDSSGNFGIGTSSPQTRLHAFSSATTTTVSIQGSLSAGANTPTLDFTGNNGGYSFGARIQAIRDTSAGGYALTFGTTTNNAAESSAPTERMRIDSSGNVGIGTSSPSTRLHVFNSAATSTAFKGNTLLTVSSNANGADATISLGDGVANNAVISQLSGALLFGTGSGTPERMRIDSSGRVLVGITSSRPNGGFLQVSAQGQTGVVTYTTSTTSNNAAYFENGNGTVGTITTNGSATAYNTSSDYRLKENIASMTGALAKVAQLKPVTYKWKVDGSDGQGFIAHELDEVVPGCVTGEKDAVDANGNPQYQGIDTSFLVATLTAAIQEQQALITALTARITALETPAVTPTTGTQA